MDVVEFAEKYYNVELPDWQKKYLRLLNEMRTPTTIHIVMPKDSGRTQAYIYIDQIKELLSNGAQNDSK